MPLKGDEVDTEDSDPQQLHRINGRQAFHGDRPDKLNPRGARCVRYVPDAIDCGDGENRKQREKDQRLDRRLCSFAPNIVGELIAHPAGQHDHHRQHKRADERHLAKQCNPEMVAQERAGEAGRQDGRAEYAQRRQIDDPEI